MTSVHRGDRTSFCLMIDGLVFCKHGRQIAYRGNTLLHGIGETTKFVDSSVADYVVNSTVIVDPLLG